MGRRLLAGALVTLTLAVATAARAQEDPAPSPGAEPAVEPVDELAPLRAPPPRAEPDAPPAEPAAVMLPEERPLESEPVIDERRAPPEPQDPVCVSCILIGVGTTVLIAAIPLGARLDGATRERDRMRVWIAEQGGAGADVGFIAGYGIARADQEELTFGVATGLVAGTGAILLGVGVGMVIYQGDFMKNPKEKRKASRELDALPLLPFASVTDDGAAVGIGARF